VVSSVSAEIVRRRRRRRPPDRPTAMMGGHSLLTPDTDTNDALYDKSWEVCLYQSISQCHNCVWGLLMLTSGNLGDIYNECLRSTIILNRQDFLSNSPPKPPIFPAFKLCTANSMDHDHDDRSAAGSSSRDLESGNHQATPPGRRTTQD
jgi:hypothetical protein